MRHTVVCLAIYFAAMAGLILAPVEYAWFIVSAQAILTLAALVVEVRR